MPSLNVISSERDATLSGIATRCEHAYWIDSLDEIPDLLGRVDRSADTLDLIGHSTRGHNYLRIAQTPIDMLDPHVRQSISRLRTSDALQRRGICRVRLLGCETAVTPAGQRTMAWLGKVLGVAVFGTTKPLAKSHYATAGFNPQFDHLLVEAGSLPVPRSRLKISRVGSWREALEAASGR